jgi:hypothetical protein
MAARQPSVHRREKLACRPLGPRMIACVRKALLGLIWITACYSPRVSSNVPCSASGECPTGQACVAGFCVDPGGEGPDGGSPDAGSPDAPPGTVDTDRDGIPDDRDNCPTIANTDQANEDGDPFGDACDLCPQISDDGADSDGDHIGDACDPNPGVADTVLLFSGFNAGLPAWSRSAHWTGSGGNVVTMSAGNTIADNEFLVAPFTAAGVPDNFSATTTVMVQTMMGSNGDHAVGVEIFDSNAQNGVDCELDQGFVGPNPVLLLKDNTNNLKKSTAYSWTTGMQYLITLTRHGSTYDCTVTGPGGTSAKLSGTSNLVPRDGDTVDIWGFGATAQYGSVEIIGKP